MKVERAEIEAIINRALSYITREEARALGAYEPEAIAAFVQRIESLSPKPEETQAASKISCPHCGATENLTYFYAETACYIVRNESEGKPHIRCVDSSREMNDGIGSTAGYLHCPACGRETLIPLWVESSFEHY